MIVEDQSAVLAFLTDPASYDLPVARVTTTETHISAIVFVGSWVFKLKRAVRLPYVDFSTVAQRLAACRQELDLNRRTAPMLYVAVRRITREADGKLAFDGPGELVDAVVEMVRFNEDTLFDRMAVRGQLTPALMTELARTVVRFHAGAAIEPDRGGADRVAAVLEVNEQSFAAVRVCASGMITRLTAELRRTLDRHAALLNARAQAGKVRHCHGDLHLRNICLVDGAPTLFDCIEFDAALATVDVLYDLAFLLMDLWHRGLAASANLVFNRYLDECDEIDSVALLPFFMALRAAVRAHVAATQAGQQVGQRREALICESQAYIVLALRLLTPVPARLVAVGGLSGSGKSTVAAVIAGDIGPAPGARVLASDRIRKQLHGVTVQTRLPASAYQPEISDRVYAEQAQQARTVLAHGHAVVADAVFDRLADRRRIEHIARDAGVPFTGLWLHARADALFTRVDARHGDASDATVDVVRAQLARDAGSLDWIQIEADGTAAATAVRATAVLTQHA